jgi:trans-aconitate methyltransferase
MAFVEQLIEIRTPLHARLDAKLEVISSHADVVLDLGAGTGLLSQSLLQRFPNSKIICLDFFAIVGRRCRAYQQRY